MVERQPGRPSAGDFVDAAKRVVSDEYDPRRRRTVWLRRIGWIDVPYPLEEQREDDKLIILKEHQAEGRQLHDPEIAELANSQLASYYQPVQE